jgi:hypothetical protein
MASRHIGVRIRACLMITSCFAFLHPIYAMAQTTPKVDAVNTHIGSMSSNMTMPRTSAATDTGKSPIAGTDVANAVAPASIQPSLRFEPMTMLPDLFRSDLVFLMRHGPTDWSMKDNYAVAPDDCAHQRVMTPAGREDMVNLGILLAGNGIRPAEIDVSQWCRAQQTVVSLKEGFGLVDKAWASTIRVETDPNLNLLLSLGGAANTVAMRERIMGWEGKAAGPLLIISHFTNIDEITDFHVYEGEILVIDPKREGRVLGYLRLDTAGPDIGHFPNANAASGLPK